MLQKPAVKSMAPKWMAGRGRDMVERGGESSHGKLVFHFQLEAGERRTFASYLTLPSQTFLAAVSLWWKQNSFHIQSHCPHGTHTKKEADERKEANKAIWKMVENT
jgi:hypothetical protein